MLGKKVNDPEIVEMDDVTWAWHYASWLEDERDKAKMMRAFGCFMGSFVNPEAARRIQNMDDNNKQVGLTEEEFDKSCEYVKKSNEIADKQRGKKRKKLKIKNGA
jgi:hypothetical protein